MSKYYITLNREVINGFLLANEIGIDAFNALNTFPGVVNVEIINESRDRVKLAYEWEGEDKFWKTVEHLIKYCLARANS